MGFGLACAYGFVLVKGVLATCVQCRCQRMRTMTHRTTHKNNTNANKAYAKEMIVSRIKQFEDLGCSVFFPRLVEANFHSESILKHMKLFSDQVLPHFGSGPA